MTRTRGFTLLELLIAMALFAVLGLAVVALLGQGMNIFAEGTADTRMQDRLQAILPTIRADLAAVQPAAPPEVLPPPAPDLDPTAGPATAPILTPPALQFRMGWAKLAEFDDSWGTFFYVAFVRTNAREGEDPLLRQAGSVPVTPGLPTRVYDPSAVDALTGSAAVTSLVAPGGLLEVVWIAVPEDPDPARRAPSAEPIVVGPDWPRGMLTLYRLFRAPAGGEKSLLLPRNFDSLGKIRAAGRPMHEGVIHFGVTARNIFAKSWNDGLGSGRADDGQAYVGSVWDSTRALDRAFPFYRNPDSLADVRDDVFPAWARIELTLGVEGEFGFGRGETVLAEALSPEDKRVALVSVDPLYAPGPEVRWLKVEGEWMATTLQQIDPNERRVVVVRGQRGTKATAHDPGAPVFVGSTVSTEVPMVYKDRYVPRTR